MMVDSIKKTNPQSKVIQVTDISSPEVDQIDDCLRFNLNISQLMKFRFEAYSRIKLEKNISNLFIDSDMLIMRPLKNLNILLKKDIILCKRQINIYAKVNTNLHNLNMTEYKNKTAIEAWPYLGCFIAMSNKNYFEEMNKMYNKLPEKYKFWYGDQIILKDYSDSHSELTSCVGELQYACLPTINSQNDVNIFHFKGNNKSLMIDYYNNFFA